MLIKSRTCPGILPAPTAMLLVSSDMLHQYRRSSTSDVLLVVIYQLHGLAADPVWAAINRGALICKNCAGVHRNLGVHVSKVRSLTLDDWAPSFLAIMRSVGNEQANSVWEVRGSFGSGMNALL